MRNVNLDISSKFFIFIQRSNLKFTKKIHKRPIYRNGDYSPKEIVYGRNKVWLHLCQSLHENIFNNQCLSKKVPRKHTKDIRSVNLYVLWNWGSLKYPFLYHYYEFLSLGLLEYIVEYLLWNVTSRVKDGIVKKSSNQVKDKFYEPGARGC